MLRPWRLLLHEPRLTFRCLTPTSSASADFSGETLADVLSVAFPALTAVFHNVAEGFLQSKGEKFLATSAERQQYRQVVAEFAQRDQGLEDEAQSGAEAQGSEARPAPPSGVVKKSGFTRHYVNRAHRLDVGKIPRHRSHPASGDAFVNSDAVDGQRVSSLPSVSPSSVASAHVPFHPWMFQSGIDRRFR